MQNQCTGEIVLQPDTKAFTNATAHVFLEDVSTPDAPSQLLSKQCIGNISHKQGVQTRIRFSLQMNSLDQKRIYSIRVLLDLDGDGQISKGDLVSTSYNLVTENRFSNIHVLVKEV